MSNTRGSTVYERVRGEGHAAFFRGLTLVDCPYPRKPARAWWVDGWRAARDADQNPAGGAR